MRTVSAAPLVTRSHVTEPPLMARLVKRSPDFSVMETIRNMLVPLGYFAAVLDKVSKMRHLSGAGNNWAPCQSMQLACRLRWSLALVLRRHLERNEVPCVVLVHPHLRAIAPLCLDAHTYIILWRHARQDLEWAGVLCCRRRGGRGVKLARSLSH